jgi:hypothetical protein
MPRLSLSGGSNAIALIVSYTLQCDVIAKACSSPQTAEINIDSRADTLMKWVNIGTVEGLIVIGIAAFVEKDTRNAVLAGGILATVVTYGEYLYAKKSGLENPGPSTEQHHEPQVSY